MREQHVESCPRRQRRLRAQHLGGAAMIAVNFEVEPTHGHYRIRVAKVVRDYALTEGVA